MLAILRFYRWFDDRFIRTDGLDTTEYVEHIERDFEIKIRDEDCARLKTLGDLCEFVSKQLCDHGRPQSDEQIWNVVGQVTSQELGVMASELHPEIRFIEDLNC